VAIPLFNPYDSPASPSLQMVNFLSVFVNGVAGATLNTYIVPARGRIASGDQAPAGASFLNVIAAIR
jgi:hypothetical protein